MYDGDATHAYRGYRLQALYVLSRVLDSDTDLLFTPEGNEDLSISTGEKEIEIVQVKSYNGLVLSHLEPSNENSFFHRVNKLLDQDASLEVKLVNIGLLGPEIENAWEGEGAHRNNIRKKLNNFGFSDAEIQRFFERVLLVPLEEDSIRDLVFQRIRDLLAGVNDEHAFDLLQKWLFDLSENRSTVSQNKLIDKIHKIGKFLNDRNLYHSEWFTNISPISNVSISDKDQSALEEEFFEGVSARYEHIAAGLDFLRPSKMRAMKQGFANGNIVVIHGASGQGKTTLAYRYLHDNYPEQLRYKLQAIQDRNQALKVAGALSGYAEALEVPIIVYFDVTPRDQDWVELLVQLSSHSFINILVSIREEDFKRANIPYDIHFSDVDLELFIEEARQIYQRALDKQTSTDFLSFEDAWQAFGGEGGPLLEFVYLLTQTETLTQRLKGQVKRLKDEVREKKLSPDELKLLKLASVISAYEGRIHLPALLKSIDLPEPSTTLHYYEQEYLIRVSEDKQFIEGLHPIRSQILVELLIDPGIESWTDLAALALPMSVETGWETFLLSAYVYNPEIIEDLIDLTLRLEPRTWSGLAGVFRSLLWIGVKTYVERNKPALDQAIDLMGRDSFWFVMDLNFGGNYTKNIDGWWDNLSDELIAPENKKKIREIRNKQTSKNDLFELANEWLCKQSVFPESPKSHVEWQDVSELLYWDSRITPKTIVTNWISNENILDSFHNISLRDFSSLMFAIYMSSPDRYQVILSEINDELILRLMDEYQIIELEELDETLIVHFLTSLEDKEVETHYIDKKENKIHSETIKRIEIIRQLFPRFMKYGSQGYGHNLDFLGLPVDDSKKTGIPRDNFPPIWVVRLNSIASGLIRNEMRMEGWNEYLETILSIRQNVVDTLSLLQKHLNRYFQREKVKNFLDEPPFSTDDWDHAKQHLDFLPLLPKVAADVWGIGQPEGDVKSSIYLEGGDSSPVSQARSSALQRKYFRYRKVELEYKSRLKAFYEQAIHVAVVNIRTGKLIEDSAQKKAIIAELESQGVNTSFLLLSKVNLWEAYNNLINYQREFRDLFSEKLDAQFLDELEKTEIETLETLLWSWFMFVDEPRTALSNPKNQILQRIENYLEKIRYQISELLKSEGFSYGATRILEQKTDWDGHPAVWIQLDINPSILEINRLDELISSLRALLGLSEYGTFEYSFAETYMRFIVVVMTVEGKSLDGKVYPLKTILTLLQNHDVQEKPYLYIPQEISHEEMEAVLNIPIWELEQLQLANEFEISFGLLMDKLSLLEQTGELLDLPDESTSILEDYLEMKSAEVTEALQSFMDAKSEILIYLQNIPEKNINDEISEAIGILIALDDELIIEDGKLHLASDQFKSYVENLQTMAPYISVIRLIYLFTVLNQRETI